MTVQTRMVPGFVPENIRMLLVGRRFTLPKLPLAVRRRMRTPERIRVSEHARRYRVVTEEPHPGPWRHELAPHTVKIMDAYSQPHVREIWFCGVDQSGKTNSMLNCMHWAVDVDPGNVFYLMPTESTAQKVVQDKLIPMVRASKRLRQYLSNRDDDVTISRIKFGHGVVIRPAWANSAASMATFAAKHCFGDEVDKYPEKVGKETGPIALIKKRNRLYSGRYKRFFASTPAQGVIYQGMLSCRQVWEMRQRCPHCGQLFRPAGACLNIPEGLGPEDIDQETELSYNCTECGAAIGEEERLELLREPCWVCIRGSDVLLPTTVGFHHRAWDCRDVPLHEIAQAWLAAQKGGVVEKIAWANGYEAENYEYEVADRREDFILRLRDDAHPRGLVPRDTSCIIVVADTQQLGFHYAVFALGWGEALPITKIEHGYVAGFAELNAVAFGSWQDADGNEYQARSGWIDSGGGTNPAKPQHSRTNEVYRFCSQYKFWRPLKGRQRVEQRWSDTWMDFYPSREGRREKIQNGLRRYNIDVTMYKDDLATKLMIELDDPGAIRFDAATTSDYAAQLCAEYRDERGLWHCPAGRANHQWDILVYALAAADIMSVRRWKREQAEAPQGPVVYSRGVQL